MDPVSALAVASIGTSVAGGIVGAKGARQQADANVASAQYQAAVARNNSIIAEQNAQREIAVGAIQGETQNYATRATVGKQKAVQGASGIDVNSGSALDVRTSTINLGELDAMTIFNNAQQRAAGYRAQASNFTAESGLDQMKAYNADKAGDYAVASSLISSASSVSDKWLSYKQKGIF